MGKLELICLLVILPIASFCFMMGVLAVVFLNEMLVNFIFLGLALAFGVLAYVVYTSDERVQGEVET